LDLSALLINGTGVLAEADTLPSLLEFYGVHRKAASVFEKQDAPQPKYELIAWRGDGEVRNIQTVRLTGLFKNMILDSRVSLA
jgi:hypothetical protein